MAACKYTEELAVDHMRDPREWMPVSLMKGGQSPGEPPDRNAAIHHRVLFDVRKVIDSDEVMPDHLHINPKCGDGQTGGDEPECHNAADLESFWGSSVGCVKADSFSLLCCL